MMDKSVLKDSMMDESVLKDIHFNEYGRVDVDYYIAVAKHERNKAIAEIVTNARKKLKRLFSHEGSLPLHT